MFPFPFQMNLTTFGILLCLLLVVYTARQKLRTVIAWSILFALALGYTLYGLLLFGSLEGSSVALLLATLAALGIDMLWRKRPSPLIWLVPAVYIALYFVMPPFLQETPVTVQLSLGFLLLGLCAKHTLKAHGEQNPKTRAYLPLIILLSALLVLAVPHSLEAQFGAAGAGSVITRIDWAADELRQAPLDAQTTARMEAAFRETVIVYLGHDFIGVEEGERYSFSGSPDTHSIGFDFDTAGNIYAGNERYRMLNPEVFSPHFGALICLEAV